MHDMKRQIVFCMMGPGRPSAVVTTLASDMPPAAQATAASEMLQALMAPSQRSENSTCVHHDCWGVHRLDEAIALAGPSTNRLVDAGKCAVLVLTWIM
jgi:hypothetical protein